MTAPRRILPGSIYLVTRRCSERRYFLRPSPLTNDIFLFVLAVAAARHGIRVHAFCVLSNHYHLVVTDPRACLPAFVQQLDALVARAMNALLGRKEGFWGSDRSYSAVLQASPADVVRKIAYTLANPVAAELVEDGRAWPGLWTPPDALARERRVIARPAFFFQEDGAMPETVELTLALPDGFADADAFRADVAAELDRLEVAARQRVLQEGKRFLGRERVLAQDPFDRPREEEPLRRANPIVACADRARRLELVEELKSFAASYREAWSRWSGGLRDVVFPAGTYWLRVAHAVPCCPSG